MERNGEKGKREREMKRDGEGRRERKKEGER